MIKLMNVNGLTVIYEKLPYVKSVSLGIWIKVGTAYENRFPNGIAHFTEHMIFKGTHKRSAKDIAEELDSVGGYLNAFSAKEYTCFYARVVDEHLELAMDILSDITVNSKYDPVEFQKEREVVIEEILMYEDNPDELANDTINEVFWKDHPFGRNILGTIESVKSIKRDDMLEYVRENYTRENTIISITGNFDESELIDYVEKYFKDMPGSIHDKIIIPDDFSPDIPRFIHKDINQSHFCMAMNGPSQTTNDKYAFGILSSIIGGGMSSRLFQDIRETHGLVYTIYSYTQSHKNSGMFVVYFACNDKNTSKVTELVIDSLTDIKKNNVTEKELSRGKEQLKGNIILSLENTSARMRRQASSLIYYDRLIEIEDVVRSIDSVSRDDIARISDQYMKDSYITACMVGPEVIDFKGLRGRLC